jgi:hypothetical protein
MIVTQDGINARLGLRFPRGCSLLVVPTLAAGRGAALPPRAMHGTKPASSRTQQFNQLRRSYRCVEQVLPM